MSCQFVCLLCYELQVMCLSQPKGRCLLSHISILVQLISPNRSYGMSGGAGSVLPPQTGIPRGLKNIWVNCRFCWSLSIYCYVCAVLVFISICLSVSVHRRYAFDSPKAVIYTLVNVSSRDLAGCQVDRLGLTPQTGIQLDY